MATSKKPNVVLNAQKSKVKGAKILTGAATQTHLRIAEIRDNVLVLKNGGIRAVLETSSINFNLKSEDEQNALIYSYQGFLNTLDFPVQIVVRSRKLDLDHYLADLGSKAAKQTNPLLKKQTEEYVEYIERLLEYADIMEKSFYVVIPYDPYRAQKKNIFAKFLQRIRMKDNSAEINKRNKEFGGLVKKLTQRVNTAQSGLENCGLKVKQLSTSELVQVFYEINNPLTSRNQKVDGNTNISDLGIV